MQDEQVLLNEIKEAAEAIGIAPTTLCQRAVKNGALVGRLEGGKTVTAATIRKIRGWIAENNPGPDAALHNMEQERQAS